MTTHLLRIAEDEIPLLMLLVKQLNDVNATPNEKQLFVEEIILGMPFIVGHARDTEKLRKEKTRLKKQSSKLKQDMDEFQKSILSLRTQLGGNLRAAHLLNPHITKDCNWADIIAYFDTFQKELSALKIPAGKGKHNDPGQSAGAFLYKTYKRVFGKPPQSGKGRRPYGIEQITDYDNFCNIIAKTYNVKISHGARTMSKTARKKVGRKSKK